MKQLLLLGSTLASAFGFLSNTKTHSFLVMNDIHLSSNFTSEYKYPELGGATSTPMLQAMI